MIKGEGVESGAIGFVSPDSNGKSMNKKNIVDLHHSGEDLDEGAVRPPKKASVLKVTMPEPQIFQPNDKFLVSDWQSAHKHIDSHYLNLNREISVDKPRPKESKFSNESRVMKEDLKEGNSFLERYKPKNEKFATFRDFLIQNRNEFQAILDNSQEYTEVTFFRNGKIVDLSSDIVPEGFEVFGLLPLKPVEVSKSNVGLRRVAGFVSNGSAQERAIVEVAFELAKNSVSVVHEGEFFQYLIQKGEEFENV